VTVHERIRRACTRPGGLPQRADACLTDTVKATARIHSGLILWSGQVSYTVRLLGSDIESFEMELTRMDGACTWRAFTRARLIEKLRRHAERHGHIIAWREMLT
jgi:hypothetical protein